VELTVLRETREASIMRIPVRHLHLPVSSVWNIEETCSSKISAGFQRNAWGYIPALYRGDLMKLTIHLHLAYAVIAWDIDNTQQYHQDMDNMQQYHQDTVSCSGAFGFHTREVTRDQGTGRRRQVREMPRPLGPLWPADRRQVLARGWATEQEDRPTEREHRLRATTTCYTRQLLSSS
jgi:hypothetical protein